MRRFIALVTALILGICGEVRAHGRSDSHFGGEITRWGQAGVVEVLVRDGGLWAWVRDGSGKPVAAKGKARVIVQNGTLELVLAEEGRALVARSSEILAATKLDARLSLSLPGHPDLAVNFRQDAFIEPCLSPRTQGGRRAFEANCARCHGSSLRGTDKGPSLLLNAYGAEAGHDDSSVISAMTKGVKSHMWRFGDMPRPPGLKPGDAEAILAYIRAAQAENATFPPSSPDGGAHHHK